MHQADRQPRVRACTGRAGTGGGAGHAVNPSMGARRAPSMAHDGPAPPPAPAPGQFIGAQRTTIRNTYRQRTTQQTSLCVALRCQGNQPTVQGGGVWVRGTVVRHGWRTRAYRDVLAACPANPHTPAHPDARANQGFALSSSSALQLLKETTPHPRRDRHTLSPMNSSSPVQIAAKPTALAVSNGSRKKNTPSNNPRLGAMYWRMPTSDSGIRFTP